MVLISFRYLMTISMMHIYNGDVLIQIFNFCVQGVIRMKRNT